MVRYDIYFRCISDFFYKKNKIYYTIQLLRQNFSLYLPNMPIISIWIICEKCDNLYIFYMMVLM